MVDINKLTPGTLVRIISLDEKKKNPFGWNYEGNMDHWCGQIMTVRRVVDGDFVNMEEDTDEFSTDGWCWYSDMIEKIVDDDSIIIY